MAKSKYLKKNLLRVYVDKKGASMDIKDAR